MMSEWCQAARTLGVWGVFLSDDKVVDGFPYTKYVKVQKRCALPVNKRKRRGAKMITFASSLQIYAFERKVSQVCLVCNYYVFNCVMLFKAMSFLIGVGAVNASGKLCREQLINAYFPFSRLKKKVHNLAYNKHF